MWSCRLNKIKSGRTRMSITNSRQLAEVQDAQSLTSSMVKPNISYLFSKIVQWPHLLELFVGGNLLAMLLALAEAQSWSNLVFEHVLGYMLYINWVLLSFAALMQYGQKKLQDLSLGMTLLSGFFLLQIIVLVTTLSLNILIFFGINFSFKGLTAPTLFEDVTLHLGYGLLLGAFCFRYLYLREQWFRQQHSELNARVQAMQARIHPHFLFNSLNNVICLIAIDPDKAEQMLLNLSRLFRASFQELKLVKLSDEIELCQRYLAIEQIRLGDRLQVEWKIEHAELCQQVQIPLLTLQPLLENSIFHGVEKFLTKSTISVLIEILQNQVNIVITNPFTKETIHKRQGHGIAIENVKQRLEAYFGRTVSFQTYAGEGMYTTVVQYQYK